MMRILLCLVVLSSFAWAADTSESFALRNAHGLEARITNYGGIWTHMLVPDRNGKLGDRPTTERDCFWCPHCQT